MAAPGFSEALAEMLSFKLDQLKILINAFNENLRTNISRNGNKQPLQDRIKGALIQFATEQDKANFNYAREIIRAVKNGQDPSRVSATPRATTSAAAAYSYPPPPRPAPAPAYAPPTYHQPQPSTSNYRQPSAGLQAPTSGAYGYQNGFGGYSTASNLPPPRFGVGSSAGGSVQQRTAGWEQAAKDIQFKPSPLYRIDKALSQPGQIVKAIAGERKTVALYATLDNAQRDLLQKSKAVPSGPQYRVFLFCASEDGYNPSRMNSQPPAPIEFPAVCEIKLNGSVLLANTKGIKKQPGTAPPVDLSKVTGPGALNGANNRIEFVYMNTEKRYFLVPCLVEVFSVKQVVERIKRVPVRSKESVMADIIRTNSDDDFEASALSLTLKDPLTFSRIKTPIRSRKCNHISCFDAEVFVMMNEQTPQWGCPICSKTLQFDQLQIDGFFKSILDAVPSSVEEVSVEPDATWRSSDGKFGTAKPKPKSVAPSRDTSIKPDTSSIPDYPLRDTPTIENAKGKARAHSNAIELSDTDDEDEPLAKRQKTSYEPSTSNGNGAGSSFENRLLSRVDPAGALSIGSSPTPPPAAAPAIQRPTEVLDLTLSSSDDEDEPPMHVPPRRNGFYSSSLGNGPPSTNSATPAVQTPGEGPPKLSEQQQLVKDRIQKLRQERELAAQSEPPR